jgi:Tol biopolymer transport system component/serine/threonine protein kinase
MCEVATLEDRRDSASHFVVADVVGMAGAKASSYLRQAFPFLASFRTSELPSHDLRDQLQRTLGTNVTLDRELGGGGMSHVFLATETSLGRQIVVKVLPPEAAAAVSADRFKREIQLAARLQHPHIVPLLSAGETDGLPFYTMPYVRGESLRARLSQHGELSVNEAVHVLRDIASALACAHDEGVVHRDIKPENVILTGGVAVVTDFGIAKAMDDASVDGGHGTAITTLGVALGTPAYMAPEQATADPHVDRRADIYSFGCIAYEMLAGSSPFAGRPMQQLLAAHVTEMPEPLAKRRPTVSPALAALVMKCLEKRPGDRPQSAQELITALDAVAAPSGPVRPTSARLYDATPAHRRWRNVAIGLGFVVALIAVVVALRMRQSSYSAFQVGPTRPIADTPELESDPAISPDGKLVAYSAGMPPAIRIYVRQVDGGRPNLVSGDIEGMHSNPRWSPDGSRISFVANGAVYVVPALGGTPRRLIDRASTHAWSPEGKEIAFERADGLWIRDVDGGVERQIIKSSYAHSPAWSPDGRLIAYVEGLRPIMGNVSVNVVWTARRDGTNPIRISDSTQTSLSPVFAPDGTSLLFVSSEGGIRDVYQQPIDREGRAADAPVRLTTGLSPFRISLSADGSRLAYDVVRNFSNVYSVPISATGTASLAAATQITRENQHIEAVAVSHDGKWIAYDSDRSGNFDIYKMRLDGGDPIQLTSAPSNEFKPAWSPDDKLIAYHSQRSGVRHIYTMNADGSGETQVTHGNTQEVNRAWSPDGKRIAFATMPVPGRRAFLTQYVAKQADGSWSAPKPVQPAGDTIGVGESAWSPDGALLAYTFNGDVYVMPTDGGKRTLVASVAAMGGPAVALAWRDQHTMFASIGPPDFVPLGKPSQVRTAKIVAIAMPSGRVRVAVAGDATHNFSREDFAADEKRLYFTLAAWESDVGVMELMKRK